VSLFRRRAHRRRDDDAGAAHAGGGADALDRAAGEAPGAPTHETAEQPPDAAVARACPVPAGAYLTDGASLFRVEHAIADPKRGDVLVELEDCRTSELILCSARALAERRLRAVVPARTTRSATRTRAVSS
jgi:hypothetical protein